MPYAAQSFLALIISLCLVFAHSHSLSTQAMLDLPPGSNDRSCSCSHSHSLVPNPLALPEASLLPAIATIEQIRGGRWAPSPPPVQTPTCLWSNIKATSCDDGMVQKAQDCHCMLLSQLPATGDGVTHNDPDPFIVEPLASLCPPASVRLATPERTKGLYMLMVHTYKTLMCLWI